MMIKIINVKSTINLYEDLFVKNKKNVKKPSKHIDCFCTSS